MVGIGALGVALAVAMSSRAPLAHFVRTEDQIVAPPKEDQEAATKVVTQYLAAPHVALLSENFQRRLLEKQEVVCYIGSAVMWIYGFGPDGAVAMGAVQATGKMTLDPKTFHMKRIGGFGGSIQLLNPTMRVDFIVRLTKSQSGEWFIDDIDHRER